MASFRADLEILSDWVYRQNTAAQKRRSALSVSISLALCIRDRIVVTYYVAYARCTTADIHKERTVLLSDDQRMIGFLMHRHHKWHFFTSGEFGIVIISSAQRKQIFRS